MTRTIVATALALGLPALATAQVAVPTEEERPVERPTPTEQQEERRRSFWGEEPGRPYEEVDSYQVPSLPVRLSGYFWVDTGYMEQKNTQVGAYDKDVNYAQGRFVLGASYRRDLGSLFAEARAQFVAFDNEYTKSQYEPHTQDAFVRVGGRLWDVQLGRFLAWEPYYRGNGIQRYTAEEAGALGGPSMYRLDYNLGHKDEPGQLAVHVYPLEWAAFELAATYGQESSQNNLGVRPVLALRRWGFLAMAGWEYLDQTPQDDSNEVEQTSQGLAGRLQYSFLGTTVGVDVARSDVEAVTIEGLVDGEKTHDKTSVGAFVESDLSFGIAGAGYHLTTLENEQGEENRHHQAFLSYIQRLPIEGLSVWGVLGFARAELEDVDADSEWENDMTSFRVRLQYEFR